MSSMPEYGTPDDETPELTNRDFALARRRDNTPVDPIASGRQRLADAINDLETVRDDARIEEAIRTMRGVLDRLARAS
ncbi:MAG: hypothetical protein AAFP17_19515 [Pseudomonadota bacterium]